MYDLKNLSTMIAGFDWYDWALAAGALVGVCLITWFIRKTPLKVFASVLPGAAPTPVISHMTIVRILDATTQKVWMMLTVPEHFVQWFGVPPVAATLETTSLDVRPGGEWHADMINAHDGTVMPFGGRYLEVDTQRKLVFTIVDPAHPGSSAVETVTISLKDLAGRTELTLRQEGHLSEEEYTTRLPQGYKSFIDRMSKYLITHL